MDRRYFLKYMSGLGISLGLIPFPYLDSFSSNPSNSKFTVQELMDFILDELKLKRFSPTVDILKTGDPGMRVTGVVCTMFPTIPNIQKTIELGANFMIVHEPSFYNHEDDQHLVPKNEVLEKKLDLLKDHHIAIWRFHDYIHTLVPDMVLMGVLKKLDWTNSLNPATSLVEIPPRSLGEVLAYVKEKLQIEHFRYEGDLDQVIHTIGILPGAVGVRKHLNKVENFHPDLLMVGEMSEWETGEYFRDRISLGYKSSLIILGHAKSEEPGMEYFSEWLKNEIPEIPVHHIPSGDPFHWD